MRASLRTAGQLPAAARSAMSRAGLGRPTAVTSMEMAFPTQCAALLAHGRRLGQTSRRIGRLSIGSRNSHAENDATATAAACGGTVRPSYNLNTLSSVRRSGGTLSAYPRSSMTVAAVSAEKGQRQARSFGGCPGASVATIPCSALVLHSCKNSRAS